jgi:hypothetical protein
MSLTDAEDVRQIADQTPIYSVVAIVVFADIRDTAVADSKRFLLLQQGEPEEDRRGPRVGNGGAIASTPHGASERRGFAPTCDDSLANDSIF